MKTIKNQGFTSNYIIDGHEVNKIRIFDKNGVLFQTSSGWFERKKYPHRIQSFILPVEPIRKLKENLTVDFPYYISDKDYWQKGRVILYIPAEMIAFRNTGEIVLFNMNDRISYANSCEITINAQVTEYVRDENTMEGFKYITGDFSPVTIQQHTNVTREELKQHGKDIAQLEAQLKEIDITISSYDIGRILNHFSVTKKTA